MTASVVSAASEVTQRDMANAIRFLAADAVQKANSGHPGTPLDAAPTAFTLWSRHSSSAPVGRVLLSARSITSTRHCGRQYTRIDWATRRYLIAISPLNVSRFGVPRNLHDQFGSRIGLP